MEEYDEGWGHIFIYVPRWNDLCCMVCDLIQPIIGYLQNWRYVTEFLYAFFRTMEPSQITILLYRFVEKRDCVMAITTITASYCTYIMHTTLSMDVYYPNVYISVECVTASSVHLSRQCKECMTHFLVVFYVFRWNGFLSIIVRHFIIRSFPIWLCSIANANNHLQHRELALAIDDKKKRKTN